MVGWIPINDIATFLQSTWELVTADPENATHLIISILWTLVIYFIILPAITYPVAAILPISTTYRDTSPFRLMRYIILCILGVLLPAIIWFTALISSPAIAEIFVGTETEDSWFPVSKIETRFMLFIGHCMVIGHYYWIIGLIGLFLFHLLAFKASDMIAAFIRLWDEGFYGMGGSTRFANMIEEIADRYKKQENALFLGNSLFIPWLQIGRKDDRHMITFAGSRSGKGTSSIIPNLLAWKGSMLCIDPKGTNYHVTHAHRKKSGFVFAVDPFAVCGKETDSFNPLAEIDINDMTALDQINTISEAVIYDDSNKKNAYFTEEARAIFTGYTAYVLSNKKHYPEPNIIDIFNIITRTTQEEKDLIHAHMLSIQSPLSATTNEIATRIIDGEKASGSEFYNVIQSLKNQIRWLSSPAVQRVLSHSTFNFKMMRNTPTSIYLIMPPSEIKRYKKLQRLFINTAFSNVQKGGKSPTPCLFLIDEADSLGHMEEVQKGYGYLAGFNILIWTFWQDMGQLTEMYGNALSTFIGSSRAIQVFSVTDDITLKFIADKLGNRRLGGSINPFSSKPDTQPFRERNEIEREISKESGKSYVLRHGKTAMLVRRAEYYKSAQWCNDASLDPDYPDTRLPPLSVPFLMLKEAKEDPALLKDFALGVGKIIGMIIWVWILFNLIIPAIISLF